MRRPVYNSAIPTAILIPVSRWFRPQSICIGSLFFLVLAVPAAALDWSAPEQELARKIVIVTGPGVMALTVENRSSLGRRDNDIVENGLRNALGNLGIRFAKAEQAAATVTVSLSENSASYVWVAEIHQGAGEPAVVMVAMPRPEGSTSLRDAVPLTLRKIPLWAQNDPILDVAVLDENPSPTRIAVLEPDKVALYRLQGAKWQPELVLVITHARSWPRDLRGKLVLDRDHLLQLFLPAVTCTTVPAAPVSLNCRESDDPWPLVPVAFGVPNVFPSSNTSAAAQGVPAMKAFFAPTRDFFTGAITPAVGKLSNVPKFYSLAPLPRERYVLWLFAALDGQVHLIDGVSDQTARLGWGSDIASVRTVCGAGWQVLATSSGDDAGDTVRAYEFPDRDPVAVSAGVEFSGPVRALWTEARGDTAIAIARNRETGSYEAFRLALACGQ